MLLTSSEGMTYHHEPKKIWVLFATCTKTTSNHNKSSFNHIHNCHKTSCCLEPRSNSPTQLGQVHVTARWIHPDRKAGMKMLNMLKPIIPNRILRSLALHGTKGKPKQRKTTQQKSGDEFQVLKEGRGIGKLENMSIVGRHFKIQNLQCT